MSPLPSPPPSGSKNINWRELYLAALVELDKKLIPERIAQAEELIIERARELFDGDGVNADEKEALDDALYFLQALRNTFTFETFSSYTCVNDDERKVA